MEFLHDVKIEVSKFPHNDKINTLAIYIRGKNFKCLFLPKPGKNTKLQ